jgi:hypothetical protein
MVTIIDDTDYLVEELLKMLQDNYDLEPTDHLRDNLKNAIEKSEVSFPQ